MISNALNSWKKYVHKYTRFLLGSLSTLLICMFFWILIVNFLIENQDVYTVAPKNTKWVEVGSNVIAFQHFSTDSDKNIVLIGGTTAWSGVWEKTIIDLKGTYNIYAIDLPPFGYSVVDKNYKYDLKNQAASINGFVETLKLTNVVMVAHSYGAGPTMEAVLSKPGNYEKIIIIDGAIHVDGSPMPDNVVIRNLFNINIVRYLVATFALHTPGFMEASLKYLVYNNNSVNDFWVTIYNQPLRIKNQSQKTGKWFYDFVFKNGTGISSYSKNYKMLPVPVSIIWGREDNLTPLSQGVYLQEIIPSSTITVLDEVGHIPMIDNHDRFIEALKENL